MADPDEAPGSGLCCVAVVALAFAALAALLWVVTAGFR